MFSNAIRPEENNDFRNRVSSSVLDPDFFVRWYEVSGRRFPWRAKSTTAFQILVTEMLLRQTRAEGVALLWKDFVCKYPNARTMARAKRSALAKHLGILGFGRQRADALVAASKWLVKEHAGRVPHRLDQLLAIPHIGPYSARAVLCFAFHERIEIVDTNVLRFLARFYGIPYENPDIRRNPWAWEMAAELLPLDARVIREYHYGLLDFTAKICRARQPLCVTCPLVSSCGYGQQEVSGKKQ